MAGNVIILGAGLSGLSAAYHSGFPVYEARQRPGGAADSIIKDGFVFDIGIHVLQSRNQYFLELLDKLGVALVTRKRSGWIYSYGHYSLYPFQVNTSHLPLSVRLRCVAGFLRSGRSSAHPENYEDWMEKNFGQGFAGIFLIPYAEKFWGVTPRSMTYEWTGDRVPRPRAFDVVKGAFRDQETNLGTHTQFQYPSNHGRGFGAIAGALAERISNVRYGMHADSIDPYRKLISFNSGQEQAHYDCLIPTIPLPELIRLLPSPPSDIRAAADRLSFNSIAAVNLGINRAHITDKHWVHFPEKDISFFRISFPGNFCEGLNPSGTTPIQAEVSYDKNNPPDADELVNTVHQDLVRTGILTPEDRITFKDVLYQKYGYVIYDHNRKEAVIRILEYLNSMQIFPCGRYGAWEYLWSDDAVLSGKDTAEKVMAIVGAGGGAELMPETGQPL
jgi:UDP-galactopyranose mutase